ncbi:MAG: DNA repair protein RecO [Lawsonibacter sp.]
MHTTTQALVLRSVDYKESDKILTLLTRDQGKLTAAARGCRKKGSPIAAGCQLLCWSELVLYDYQGRWSVKEAATQRQFRGVRSDLEKLALACYFAEVTELLAVEGIPSPELLSLILNSLHALDKLDKPLALVKAAFELRAMCLAGYEPMADGCAVCGADPPEEPSFHLKEGVLHCAGCRGEVGDGISLPLGQQALDAMRHIVYGDPKRLFSFPAEGEGLSQLAGLTEAYLHTQLERGFRTLDFYKQVQTEKAE